MAPEPKNAATTSPSPSAGASTSKTVVFFHPDLGIGGAERLVVDAAVSLQSRGHRVVIYTNHCDPSHCFDECRDGTLDVRVRGDWFVPVSILNRLTILCVILRHFHLLLTIALSGELRSLEPSAFIVDQLSAGLPVLRIIAPQTPILFYCHFPDLLLVRGRESALKRLYRVPFDWIEEWSMGFSQAVAVNSEFTKGVVERTWPGLKEKVELKVVYPCVDTAAQDNVRDGDVNLFGDAPFKVILSINRFERKKDIGLAVKAFAAVPAAARKGVRLVLAGGYDVRVAENVEYHAELQSLASSLSLPHHTITPSDVSSLASTPTDTAILFLLSVPNSVKTALLQAASLLVYTPSNEHFGIVPLEAMLSRLPVLAANTGGPVETIRDSRTGWLRSPDDVDAWSKVMQQVLGMSVDEIRHMGDEGATRVKSLFGRDKMALRLEASLDEISKLDLKATLIFGFLPLGIALSVGVAIIFNLGIHVMLRLIGWV